MTPTAIYILFYVIGVVAGCVFGIAIGKISKKDEK